MIRAQIPIPEEIHKIIKIHATATDSKLEHVLQDALVLYFSQSQFDYCREAIEKSKNIPLVEQQLA